MQTDTISPESKPATPAHDDDALLTSSQVRGLVGNVSAMCIWRWQRDPKLAFPQPDAVINKRNYWYRRSIRRWKAERTARPQLAVA